jgi:hypothetical protein
VVTFLIRDPLPPTSRRGSFPAIDPTDLAEPLITVPSQFPVVKFSARNSGATL